MLSIRHIAEKLNELKSRVDKMPSFEWATVVKVDPLTIMTDVSSTNIVGASLIGKVYTGDRVRLERQGNKAIVWAVGINALGSARELAPDWTSQWTHGRSMIKETSRFMFTGIPPSGDHNAVKITSRGVSLTSGRSYRMMCKVTNSGSSSIHLDLGIYYSTYPNTWKASVWSRYEDTPIIKPGTTVEIPFVFHLDYSKYPGSNQVNLVIGGEKSQSSHNYSIDNVSVVDITNIVLSMEDYGVSRATITKVSPPTARMVHTGTEVVASSIQGFIRVGDTVLVESYNGSRTFWSQYSSSRRDLSGTSSQRSKVRPEFGDIWRDTDGGKHTWKGSSDGRWRRLSVELSRGTSDWEYKSSPVFARSDVFSNVQGIWLESNEYLLLEVVGAGNGFEFSSLVGVNNDPVNGRMTIPIRKMQLFSAAHQPSKYRVSIMEM